MFDGSNFDIQRAKPVFPDKKAYLIPQIYGNLFEKEFQASVLYGLCDEEFNMILLESIIKHLARMATMMIL